MTVRGNNSFHRPAIFILTLIVSVGVVVFIPGCGGSEETQMESPPNMVDSLHASIDSLITENVQCKSQVSRLEQENRNLVAQRAELETKFAEERERAKTPPPTSGGISNAQMEYENGLNMQRQRNYQEAVSIFMGLLNTGAPEGLESNCHYWIGEGYYGMKQYKDALTHLEQVLGYTRSTKKDDAQLMIANCYSRMRDKERAMQEYQKLIDQYPASPFVQRAKDALAKMK